MKRLQLFMFLSVLLYSSCNKLLDAGIPTNQEVSTIVYGADTSAAAVLTGLYYNMSSTGPCAGSQSFSYYCGLLADEYILQTEDDQSLALYQNDMDDNKVPAWKSLYTYIYVANAAVEGLSTATKLTPAIRQQLTGEAKFIRAFCYFYLVNLFGDVPLATSTDYKVNATLPRTTAEKIYEQMTADLLDAEKLLRADYVQADILTATTERIRPNKWAATALLARVYLFRGNWDAAVLAATTVIEHKELYDTVPLNTVFLKHSREAIWQLQPVDRTFTADAELFAVQRPVLISDDLLQAFEPDDARKQLWLGDNEQYYPYKYKVVTPGSPTTEYTMVLRLAEQYLIRAEAWARSGHPEEARADLNVIRQRAGLRDMGVTTTELLLATILHERRIEFFSEWGHRWLDLKRTGKVNAVMSGVTPGKGGSWQSYKQWYPIPRSELLLNHNLVQNTGY